MFYLRLFVSLVLFYTWTFLCIVLFAVLVTVWAAGPVGVLVLLCVFVPTWLTLGYRIVEIAEF